MSVDAPTAVTSPPLLDAHAVLNGRRILLIGATGFVGKVVLSMLLRRYPNLGQLFVLVRPGAGSSSEERFFQKIVPSPVFDPIREAFGNGTDAFLHSHCTPIAGDVGRALCNFSPTDLERLGKLDAVVNVAGLVDFDPSLESALRVNVYGTQNALAVARHTGAALIHVSTCFVAGNRDGEIWEDEPLLGAFPRKRELLGAEFTVANEIVDCQRLIDQVKAQADDFAHGSKFRQAARDRFETDGRDVDDEKALRLAVARERKTWVSEELRRLGTARATHWGWPNTYTYTKALGDQVCASATDVRTCIVRPSIVESAMRYPFPGWNEGFTTTAPIAFLGIRGQQHFPAGVGNLDVVPVDMVASGLIMATAATIAKQNSPVYQLASSDVAPFPVRRAVELLGLYKRRYYQQRRDANKGSALYNFIQMRLEPTPVDRETFNARSTPLLQSLTQRARDLVTRNRPRWGMPRLAALAEHTLEQLDALADVGDKTQRLFDQFMPFMYERQYTFRCDNTRALFLRLAPHDKLALPWDPERIDWRDYWLNVHLAGLERWIFPSLEEEFSARPKTAYTYHDLLEMFDLATRRNRERTAFRLVAPGQTDHLRYTYGDLQKLAGGYAAVLQTHKLAVGDRVLLVAESSPEWSLAYFGILKAGAIAVPVDPQASTAELANIIAHSRPRVCIWSDKAATRFADTPGLADVVRLRFADIQKDLRTAPPVAAHRPKPDDVASLLFTSGTTGRPKGVMLSHKNFTSLLSRLAGLFDIDKHDGLLSVLPLHHTFEFTAGLLLPLMRGAEVSYLDELTPDTLRDALGEGRTTAMVGVPALWQLLFRKMRQPFAERSPLVLELFDQLLERFRGLRDRLPPRFDSVWQVHLGKLLFWPIHARLGGRLRLLISGGAALPLDVAKAFRGLGFQLYEGYGMTESSPVLTVNRPGRKLIVGSVGEPLPGVEVRIANPDERGVGEVIAQGPNVMLGYYENAEATDAALQNGWLHTGDLGRFDDDGRLHIVGRKKEMILAANGENIYPDELEELYGDHELVRELSIVGVPDQAGGETIAMLARADDSVPAAEGRSRDEIFARLDEHFRSVSAKLPAGKRVRIVHFTDRELPRTTTRKVKRRDVIVELERLERLREKAIRHKPDASNTRIDSAWLAELVATVSGKRTDEVLKSSRLADLGFDSLMYTELGSALDAGGIKVPENVDVASLATLADLEQSVTRWGHKSTARARITPRKKRVTATDEIAVPDPVSRIGRSFLRSAQRLTYERLFESTVTGQNHIPQDRPFLVVANHASHLDMGLCKHALGDWGDRLVAVAAKDYFFNNPLKRAYFENFTNLVPMDRHGSLRESLRLASDVIADGHILLIFPEGTRSADGVMTDFKPSIGYLALANERDILPIYLDGTFAALPKGGFWPEHRHLAAHIGTPLKLDALRAHTKDMSRAESYREIARLAEDAVRSLAPVGSVNRRPAERPASTPQRFGSETVIVQTE